MVSNPVIKPKVATPALILTSAGVALCAVFVLQNLTVSWPPDAVQMFGWAAVLPSVLIVSIIWLIRTHRRRNWLADAKARWSHFEEAKRAHRTTAEITVLSIDALEPTGAWITIIWNRFGHLQRAWMEALEEPIWVGSVLLISPDPSQVTPGAPWPATYYVQASNFLAWAPDNETLSGPIVGPHSKSMSFK
ncbi:hypothetical protein [Arthrobacter sp. MMS18-M83]|uniref:hypothetical protein n=1 Tax=Arthrobacter sp. MMS18-M83 TaxID=2996261 RepID=UPI00227BC025|nr:hypothetical protein [Arthrobacter sp. MMS18-M83]WAH96196.1 hypothetical protein OW521_17465 [Arthrobacter sp. MMS18-M83]